MWNFFRKYGYFSERTSIFSHVWVPMEDSLVVIDCVNGGSSSMNYEVYRISGHRQQNNAAPIGGCCFTVQVDN